MIDTAQLLLTIVGGAAGGILTIATTFFNNRQKTEEIQLGYKHKLDEVYRTSAREYIEPLYKPLNKILTKVDEQYDTFLRGRYAYEETDEVDTSDEEALKVAFEEFFSSLSELLKDGDSAYLTEELDGALSDFTFFLKLSIHAKEPIFAIHQLPPHMVTSVMMHRPFLIFFKRNIREGVEEQLNYARVAPIGSRPFRDRFYYDIRKIRNLIREVMLKNNMVNPML